jgi:TPR repeat protein
MRAAVNLGLRYLDGKGTDVDYAQALKWTQLAADNNHPIAQNNLGHMYENGYGVPKDREMALHYYQLSADQGYDLGRENLERLQSAATEEESPPQPPPAPDHKETRPSKISN